MSKQRELLDALKIDRDQPAAPRRNGVVIGAVVVVLAAVAILFFLLRDGDEPTAATPASSVSNAVASNNPPLENIPDAPVSEEGGDAILSASGYITARRMATVASRITGLIEEVRVEEGMLVKAGDVLARLNDDLAKVDFKLAKARLQVARAERDSVASSLAEAERVLRRIANLKISDFSSEAALTEARANVERFTAQLAKANADLDVARLQVERQQEQLTEHLIVAPFAGVVTDKNAQPGEVVSPMSAGGGFTRTGICTIVDMTSLEIEVDVNEAFIGRVRVAQPVRANLDAYPDVDIPARVIAIIPAANRDKATVRVRVGIDATDPRILPDMGVKVAFLKHE